MSPSRTRIGDCPSEPPPFGNVVVSRAVLALIGTGGYRRRTACCPVSSLYEQVVGETVGGKIKNKRAAYPHELPCSNKSFA